MCLPKKKKVFSSFIKPSLSLNVKLAVTSEKKNFNHNVKETWGNTSKL